MTNTDDKPKTKKPKQTHPLEAAEFLLDAIVNADDYTRRQWDQAVVRELDIAPQDFMLGLRRLVGSKETR